MSDQALSPERIDELAWQYGLYPEASSPRAEDIDAFARACIAEATASLTADLDEARRERDALRDAKGEIQAAQPPCAWMTPDGMDVMTTDEKASMLASRDEEDARYAARHDIPLGRPDWYLRTKVADLVHLLSYADIRTPSEGDAEQAKRVLAALRTHLKQSTALAQTAQPAQAQGDTK